MKNVRSFMLATGQEMIAELVSATRDGYSVKNPLIAHMMRGPEGPQLGFAPWSMLHADVEIIVRSAALLADPVEVEGPVATAYVENTTGIALPPQTGGQILMG